MSDIFTDYYNDRQRLQTTNERKGLQANNQKSIELAAKIAEDYKNNKISVEQFDDSLKQLGVNIRDLDQYQRNYQSTQTENRGTLGENPLLSNLVQNATARQGAQQAAYDKMSLDIASNPLAQYNYDADTKRTMALENQKNLANNVRDQLTNLQAARVTNADLIAKATAANTPRGFAPSGR